jgi:hypothetical protein
MLLQVGTGTTLLVELGLEEVVVVFSVAGQV